MAAWKDALNAIIDMGGCEHEEVGLEYAGVEGTGVTCWKVWPCTLGCGEKWPCCLLSGFGSGL